MLLVWWVQSLTASSLRNSGSKGTTDSTTQGTESVLATSAEILDVLLAPPGKWGTFNQGLAHT